MNAIECSGPAAVSPRQVRRVLVRSAVVILASWGESALSADLSRMQHDLTQPATLMRSISAQVVHPRPLIGAADESPVRDDAAWSSTTQAASLAASTPCVQGFPAVGAAKIQGSSRLASVASTRMQWGTANSHSLKPSTAPSIAHASLNLPMLNQPIAPPASHFTSTPGSTGSLARAMPSLLGPSVPAGSGGVDHSVFVSHAPLNPASFTTSSGPASSGVPQQVWAPSPTR